MLAKYKWWRKLRGGYWIYEHFLGWHKITYMTFKLRFMERQYMTDNHLEDYTK